MDLTGKCKKDFGKWLWKVIYEDTAARNKFYYNQDQLPNCMRWGLIQDFADSVGYKINILNKHYQNWFYFEIKPPDISKEFKSIELKRTRPEARSEAIQKFDEMYNEK